ncbi:hypothetical protein [Helicobacter ailurogastricus]|uniref:hypothetical protein n=1 Tax=Helicobacter ailurogastricus TaxID=1578720 RepID=UPI0022CC938E|nr:hypothetical protein [Helicobacter ailurogastricus]GLH58074.1 hypothetical protein NHP214376_08630 [Helicobacter ailurogastricus]GLH59317.1 hypothetical protein NHP214377_05840 [Helicobacter ailurogastricus]
MEIKKLEKWEGWVVRIVDPQGEAEEGVFICCDGPDYDPEEEEDFILIHTLKNGVFRSLVRYKAEDIAEFIPIRKATKEEYEA